MAERLLPPNAPPLLRVSAAMFERLTEIPVPLRAIVDPRACPEAFLPWLAWQRRVTEWDDGWTVAQKRDVVETRYDIIRHNGTRWAVVQAVSKLGFDVRYENAFEYGGAPYRFRLVVTPRFDDGLSRAQIDRLARVANGAKAARSRLEAVTVKAPARPAAAQIGARVVSTIRMAITNPVKFFVLRDPLLVGARALSTINTRLQQ